MSKRIFITLFLLLLIKHFYSQTHSKTLETTNHTTPNEKIKDEFPNYTHLTKTDTATLLKALVNNLNGNWYFDDDLFGKVEVSIKLSDKTYNGHTIFYFDSKPQPELPSRLEIINGFIKIITTVNKDEQDIADFKIVKDCLTIKNATNTTNFLRKKK